MSDKEKYKVYIQFSMDGATDKTWKNFTESGFS
jgi:hypothetical protein